MSIELNKHINYLFLAFPFYFPKDIPTGVVGTIIALGLVTLKD